MSFNLVLMIYIHCFEVNHGEGSAAKPAVATLNNTVQINNNYADRSRFHWVIEKISTIPDGFDSPSHQKEISYELYFDVMGRQVTEFTKGSVIIQKITYTDGTTKANKLMILE